MHCPHNNPAESRPGKDKILLCLRSRPGTRVPPGITAVPAPHLHHRSRLRIDIDIWFSPEEEELTGADSPADQFPQHAGRQTGRQTDSQVVLRSSVLLTSFPPAVEGKEGREKPSLPPLSCQGACAPKRSSSASSSSNSNTLAVRTEDGGRGREGIQRSDRGGRGGGEEQTNGRRRGGDGRGRLGDKPLRFLKRRRCWWAALEMRDSYGAVMTQERGRRVGGSVSIGSRSPVGVNVRRGTSTKVPPSAHSSSSSFISARSLQLHTCEKLHC